jgi:hypothetical protein
MALPKSMRYLAAATLCIFVYLFVQLLHSPQTELLIPNSKPSTQHAQGDRDPQLDRKRAPASTRPYSCPNNMQRPASLAALCAASRATTMRPTTPAARASMPPS